MPERRLSRGSDIKEELITGFRRVDKAMMQRLFSQYDKRMAGRSCALPPEIGVRTVTDLLRRRAELLSGKCAVVSPGPYGDRRLTFAELNANSDRLAIELRKRWNLPSGSTVAWSLDAIQGVEALTLYHALLKARLVNVPISPRYTRTEAGSILRDCYACALVATDDRLDWADEASITREFRLSADLLGFQGSSAETGDSLPLAADDLAAILYTSGTTGVPKGVEHTQGSALAAGIAWADAFRLLASDVLQSPFPLVSGAALHFNALSAMWAGATYVIDETEVECALARIERWQSTVYVAVPSIYQYWLSSPQRDQHDLSSLRLLDYGGASMPLPVIEALRKAFPAAGLMQTYGLTEAGPGGTYLPEEYATERLGSIGSRAAGRFTRFRVVRPDGTDVGPDEVGELLLRGPSVMRGYHRDPEATATAFLGGWLRSGDQVRFDEDGFLYFVDRLKDVIVRGGYNISTVEVESVLLSHPSVADAAVVGVSHPRLGETVAAAVVITPGTTADDTELRRHCLASLAQYKCPESFTRLAEIPRNSVGKTVKALVRDACTNGAG